jgi:hypothetical protein
MSANAAKEAREVKEWWVEVSIDTWISTLA